MQLDTTELSDVMDVLQECGVDFAYSIETDGAFMYGSEDVLQVVDGLDLFLGRGYQHRLWASHAISDGYSWIFGYLMPEFRGYGPIIWHGTVIKK